MDNSWDFFINAIIAQRFGDKDKEVNDPKIGITKPGWYWADKEDNYRYSDWSGPFQTKEGALAAGRNHRRNIVKNNTNTNEKDLS